MLPPGQTVTEERMDENEKKSELRMFYTTLAFLAVPIIFQDILNSLVNMMDTVMVGQLGLAEITSVGLANQVFFLFVLFVFGVNSGSSIFMGQFWGKKDVKNLHKTMGICFGLTLSIALAFFIIAFFFPEVVMNIYSKGDQKVITYGCQYLRIICFSYFLTAISLTLSFSLRSTGQTYLTFITTLVALICNTALNYLFIFVMHMGVRGSALATVIARVTELTVLLILIKRLQLPMLGKLSEYFAADRAFLKEFIRITLPVFVNEGVWAIGTSMYNVAYKFTGTEGQGAVQIANTVQNLFQVMGMAVGSACAVMLTNALGAGEVPRAIRFSRRCMRLGAFFSVVMGIILVLVSPYLISIFNVSDAVKHTAFLIICVIAVAMTLKTLNYINIVGILRSGGDTKFCLVLDMLAVWFVGVPLVFLGAYVLHFPIFIVVAMVYGEDITKFLFAFKRVISNIWARNVVDNLS